jgi:hypothetical protein
MAVTPNTATATPVVGVPTQCGTIAGGPFDNVSVYFQGGLGGGGGPILLNLFAEVNGIQTLIATAMQQGNAAGTLVEWQLTKTGDGDNFFVNAGGSAYTVTIQDLSTLFSSNPRQPVTITIAGVDSFDTVADSQQGAALAASPGGVAALPVIGGYAQEMDVAIDQTNLPSVITVQVLADCGGGSVQAIVATANLAGTNSGVGGVFRNLVLPVATRYFVQFINNSQVAVSLTLTATTYSESVTAGGVVVLNGDVIGPSNANTVIKWSNVPLLRGAAHGFEIGDLTSDAEIPIFDIGAGEWRAFPLSGDATMTNAGVVTVTGGTFTLTGNTNGPSNANTEQAFATSTTNAPINVGAQPNPTGEIYEGFNGLTADQVGTLNAAPTKGDKVIWKDEDGSLANFTFTINGNGKNIDGAATFVMNAANPGPFGSITVLYTGTAWAIV